MTKSNSLSHIVPITDSPLIPPDALSSWSSTKDALEEKAKKLRDDGRVFDPLHIAIEILLHSVQVRNLSKSQVIAFFSHNINVEEICRDFFRNFPTLIASGYKSRPGHEYTNRSDFMRTICTSYNEKDIFIDFMDDLGAALGMQGTSLMRRKKSNTLLWAFDPENEYDIGKWKCMPYLTGEDFSQSVKIASAYETSLAKNDDVKHHLKTVKDSLTQPGKDNPIDMSCWIFSYKERRLFLPLRAWLNAQCDDVRDCVVKMIWPLASFCCDWGIELMSTDPEEGKLDGLNIQCTRIEIEENSKRGGLDVFIPSRYRFSHIYNYKDEDFSGLKEAMDSSNELFTVPATKPPPRTTPVDKARRQWKEMKDKGIPSCRRWDAIRSKMNWSKSYMERRFGKRPKSRPVDIYGGDDSNDSAEPKMAES